MKNRDVELMNAADRVRKQIEDELQETWDYYFPIKPHDSVKDVFHNENCYCYFCVENFMKNPGP